MSNSPVNIMIVDDEIAIRESLAEAIENQSYKIETAASSEEAIAKMSTSSFQLVITDLKMKGMPGDKLLKWIKKKHPKTDVVLITAYATIENAVNAMKSGATDYINKPIDLYRFRKIVQNIIEHQQLIEENLALKRQLKSSDVEVTIGSSSAISSVYKTVEKVADTDATVLIEGASGTGKELVAHALHKQSSRRDKPFIIVNCAALPDTLLENELFGHEKEAFTGAVSLKKGRFEQANGGTLFLDEISEMSLESQSGFLRILEDGCFHRVGGSDLLHVDVRIIAATNQDIVKACENGKFRYDLYYRLNVVPILMPLLKDRQDDIPVLVRSFLDEFSWKYKKSDLEVDSVMMDTFLKYDWPGNIRELKNVLERAVILSRNNQLTLEHCTISTGNKSISKDVINLKAGYSFRDMEKLMINHTLKKVSGHRKDAAKILGISVRTLQYKIKEYKITE